MNGEPLDHEERLEEWEELQYYRLTHYGLTPLEFYLLLCFIVWFPIFLFFLYMLVSIIGGLL